MLECSLTVHTRGICDTKNSSEFIGRFDLIPSSFCQRGYRKTFVSSLHIFTLPLLKNMGTKHRATSERTCLFCLHTNTLYVCKVCMYLLFVQLKGPTVCNVQNQKWALLLWS